MNVFISYRREDAAGYAGRICDRLSSALGADRVFMDVEDIGPGQDFARSIAQTIHRCQVLIAVIGPRWAASFGQRTPEADYVRHELAAALQRGITVIPVLVGGAAMPDAEGLPAEIAPLTRYNAVELADTNFDGGVNRLIAAAGGGRVTRRRWWMWTGAATLAVGAIVSAYSLWPRPVDISGRWIATMQPSAGREYRIRITLESSGGKLTGTVDYPTGSAAIQDGVLNGSELSFRTEHTPQFADAPASIRVNGNVAGEAIDLTVTTSSGATRGRAVRAVSNPSTRNLD